jgi:hypothetical protein
MLLLLKIMFKNRVYSASQLYLERFPSAIKNIKTNDHVLICKSCQKKIDLEKPPNLILREHIINKKPNLEFVLQLSRIKKMFTKLHLVLHSHKSFNYEDMDNMECTITS